MKYKSKCKPSLKAILCQKSASAVNPSIKYIRMPSINVNVNEHFTTTTAETFNKTIFLSIAYFEVQRLVQFNLILSTLVKCHMVEHFSLKLKTLAILICDPLS